MFKLSHKFSHIICPHRHRPIFALRQKQMFEKRQSPAFPIIEKGDIYLLALRVIHHVRPINHATSVSGGAITKHDRFEGSSVSKSAPLLAIEIVHADKRSFVPNELNRQGSLGATGDLASQFIGEGQVRCHAQTFRCLAATRKSRNRSNAPSNRVLSSLSLLISSFWFLALCPDSFL